jgi:hypothetical protein
MEINCRPDGLDKDGGSRDLVDFGLALFRFVSIL